MGGRRVRMLWLHERPIFMWLPASWIWLDDTGRRRKTFDGSNALFEPPAEFGRPVLEFPVEAEIMRPMLRDVGIELRLPADGDQVGLSVLQDGFRLLRFENDTDRHRRDADLVADPFGIGHLEAEAARHLRGGRRARNPAGGAVDHVDAAGLQF